MITMQNTIRPDIQQDDSQYRLYWLMTRRCNFDCQYCFRDCSVQELQSEQAAIPKYTPEHIARQFDASCKSWLIYMTGGEPMLYPNFITLAKLLTRKHRLAISTNLSTPDACELADTVEPKTFSYINAGVHITEREKLPDGLNEFLKKFLHFQNCGFDIRLLYVAYPPLLERIQRDIRLFRDRGIGRIEVKLFSGRFEGKRYPRQYSPHQRDFLRNLGLNDAEKQILDSRVSFLGKMCAAGKTAFNMNPAGNISRCNTFNQSYGNLFEGTFKPGAATRRCTARKCVCPYQGYKFTQSPGSPAPSKWAARPAKFAITFAESLSRITYIVSGQRS
jgi:MoaA/NifB/PqqE/SkfB family radical SAM enzyme